MPLAQAAPAPYTGKGAANPTPGPSSFSGAGGTAWPTGPNGAYQMGQYPNLTSYNWTSNTSPMTGEHGTPPAGYTPTGSFVGGGGSYLNMGSGQSLNIGDPATAALANYLNAQYQSNIGSLQNQLSNLGIDAGYLDRVLGLNKGFANEDYGLTLERIANNEARTNLDKQDIGANRDYLNVLAGLLPQTRALNSQTRGNAYGRAQLDYDAQFRNSLSDATARGSVNSQGLRDTRDEIARQLGLGRESADIQYGRSGIEATKDEAQIARDKSLLATKEQTLDTVAKDYGIDRRTAELALRQGMAKLGLDFDTAMQKINNSSGETQQQILQLAPMLYQQAMALAGQGS